MLSVNELASDLKRFDESLSVASIGNRIKILFHGREICYLEKTSFGEWNLQFVDEVNFVGSEGMRVLNGIARSVSRLEMKGKAKPIRYRNAGYEIGG